MQDVWTRTRPRLRRVDLDGGFGARESSSRFPITLSGRGRFWGAVIRPVKAGGEKARHRGRRAPSDGMPRVTSQRSDLRKRGDSLAGAAHPRGDRQRPEPVREHRGARRPRLGRPPTRFEARHGTARSGCGDRGTRGGEVGNDRAAGPAADRAAWVPRSRPCFCSSAEGHRTQRVGAA